MEKEYNVKKLHRELEAAGLEIEGVTSEGRIDWKGEPSQAQIEQAEMIKQQHEAQDLSARLRKAYLEKGLDAEVLVVALWEKLIEGDSSAADAVQAIREQVKQEVN